MMNRKLLSIICFLLSTLSAQATVYYVDGSRPNNTGNGLSWAAAKKDLQEAINLAGTAGDEVWVKSGTYLPTLDANGNAPLPFNAFHKTFYLKTADIKLYGGFNGTETLATQRNPATNVTILSGDLDGTGGTNDAYHVLVTLARSNACVIDGFTITGGRTGGNTSFTVTTPSATFRSYYGGGMFNTLGSSPTVSNCIFTANTAISDGAGMYNDANCNVQVNNCSFTANKAGGNGGGMLNTGNSPVVSNCVFTADTGHNGGGMYNFNCTPLISNCVFTNNKATNYGGGIIISGTSSPVITNSAFSGNMAGDGGGIYNYPSNTSFASTISGCTFSGNTAQNNGGGLVNTSGTPTVTNCSFDSNTALSTSLGGGGMFNSGSTILSVSNCTFTSNTAAFGGGMFNLNSSSIALKNATFSANTATSNGGGVSWGNGAGGSISNCIFASNTGSTANRANVFKSSSSTALTVSYSLIADYSATATNNYISGDGIIAEDPVFVDAANPKGADGTFRTADDGLALQFCSPARNAGTTLTPALLTDILGNPRVVDAIDLGAYENQSSGVCSGIFYVDGGQPDNSGNGRSWATAKKDVQSAINLAATAGDEVWVKAGTYMPTRDANGSTPADARHKTFYLKTQDIKLYGGFNGTETLATERNPATNITILSGDLDGAGGTTDAYHVLVTLARTNACVIDGFTITGGRANLNTSIKVNMPNVTIRGDYGGGMCNMLSSSPTVSNCIFTGNTTGTTGGGMYNEANCNVQVLDCSFIANKAGGNGGGIYNSGNSVVLSGCVFTADTGHNGGGMYNINTTLQINNCVFTNNKANLYGGGINIAGTSSPVITNSTFSGNMASAGGGVYNYPSASTSFTLSDCNFFNNTAADNGGGLSNVLSNTTIANCSFDGNIASSTSRGGGGIYNVAAVLSLNNCTFTSNTARDGGGMFNFNGASMEVSSSTFSGNTATGNGGGIFWNLDAGGSLTNCIFYNNAGSTTNRANVYKNGMSNPLTVSYSLIDDYSATATNNYTSGAGIISGNPLFVDATNPKGADGTFRTADDGLRIGCLSPARNAGTGTTPATDILGITRAGNIDLGAYENVDPSCSNIYYVDAAKPNNTGDGLNWANAKKDLQEAINLAVNAGDEVWVKAGTYLPTLDPDGGTSNRDRTFYLTQQDIKLYGGFSGTETLATQRNPAANVTTLSGDLDAAGNNDAYHVILTVGRSRDCEIDGFTITKGRANITTSFTISATNTAVNRSYGGGIFNVSSSPVISNCTISDNYVYNNGAGISNTVGSNPAISRCIIRDNASNFNGGGIHNFYSSVDVSNTVLSGNTAVAGGGGMYSIGNATVNSYSTASNCVVTNNWAVRGGGIYITDYAVLDITNSTFSANTATGAGDGGGLQYGAGNYRNSGGSVINCIFYDNISPTPNKQNLCKNASSGTLTVSYSLIGDYSATATNNYTSGAGILSAEPLFVNAANPAGPDGIFRTADDGLQLLACSPAINSGNGSTPATDILDNSRVGGMDMGAYEYQGSAAIPALATTTVADTRDVTSGSMVLLGNCGDVIAGVFPLGASPVSGNITGKVYVQSTAQTVAQTAYARRHYDISPVTGAATATAQITLYFTQADFDDYNTARGTLPPLPVDAADAAGNKSNIRITQEHGTSATGLPGSYSGWSGTGPAKVLITPGSVLWNASATRWEVTFPVTGFSGFFLTSAINAPLPVRLLHFTARRVSDVHHKLDWATGSEDPGTSFVVERSADGHFFEKIGLVDGKGSAGSYHFDDVEPMKGHNYYRLYIREISAASRSKTALVRGAADPVSGNKVTVSPVPANQAIRLTTTDVSMVGKEIAIFSMQGVVVYQGVLSADQTIDISAWAAGNYALRLPDGEVVRIVKQ